MRGLWDQIRLPLFAVGGTVLSVATLAAVGFGVFHGMKFAVSNHDWLPKAVGSYGAMLAMAAFVVAVYYIPAIIALARRHHNAVPIFLLNTFSGVFAFIVPMMFVPSMPFLLWLISLLWSTTSKALPVRRANEQ